MKRQIRKLTLARETLRRLEDASLRKAVAGRPTNQESLCICFTDICVSEGYTECSTCNCS